MQWGASGVAELGPVIALVPARGGSKGVPSKNLVDLGGHPLLAYSIRAGTLTPGVDRVIVSTDSAEIAEIAQRYGADVPFLGQLRSRLMTLRTSDTCVTASIGWRGRRGGRAGSSSSCGQRLRCASLRTSVGRSTCSGPHLRQVDCDRFSS